jgi:hypothetical protein
MCAKIGLFVMKQNAISKRPSLENVSKINFFGFQNEIHLIFGSLRLQTFCR